MDDDLEGGTFSQLSSPAFVVAWAPLLALLTSLSINSSAATVIWLAVLLAGLNHQDKTRSWIIAYLSLGVGGCVAYLPLAISSGLTGGGAILAIVGLSLLNMLVPLLAVALAFALPDDLTYSNLIALPFLWPVVWSMQEAVSPFGRLGSLEWQIGPSLTWLLPILGGETAPAVALAVAGQAIAALLASESLNRTRKWIRASTVALILLCLATVPDQFIDPPLNTGEPVIKAACVLPQKPYTIDSILQGARSATSRGANIVLFPEWALEFSTLQALDDFEHQLSEAARRTKAIIGGGIVTPTPDGTVLRSNVFDLFGPDGELLTRYKKRHLVPFQEPGLAAGKEPSPILPVSVAAHNVNGKPVNTTIRIMTAICHDVSFPDSLPSAAYDLMLLPAVVESRPIAKMRFNTMRKIAIARRVAILTCDAEAASAFMDQQGRFRALQGNGPGFEVNWTPDSRGGRSSRMSDGVDALLVALALLTLCIEVATSRRRATGQSALVPDDEEEARQRSPGSRAIEWVRRLRGSSHEQQQNDLM